MRPLIQRFPPLHGEKRSVFGRIIARLTELKP